MSDIEGLVRAGVAKRMEAVRALDASYRQMQRRKLASIVRYNAETEFGRTHGFADIVDPSDYARRVPPSGPDDYEDAWRRIAAGEHDVLFAEPVHAFGLSSGTTGEPKTVPLTKALVRGLKRAIGYTTSCYMADSRNWSLLRGYALQMAAATRVRAIGGTPVGYITGIMGASRTYPFHQIGIPPEDVLDLDWGDKFHIIEERYLDHDVRMICGIPGYILSFARRAVTARGVAHLKELWPELSLVVTSGSALDRHRDEFERLCPGVELREMYLCTEAAFAFQPAREPGLMPMVEDVFLEFVPEGSWGEADAPRIGLGDVETGVRYVPLVTTPSGLYAYSPGDVVRFVRTDPPRMLVEGRLGNVLNLAAEKLDSTQAERALRDARVPFAAFLVCPAAPGGLLGHEWVIELAGPAPEDAAERIDRRLSDRNPLFRHLRQGDGLFASPVVTWVEPGTFDRALKRRRGQGKILRIYQDRTVRDELVGLSGT